MPNRRTKILKRSSVRASKRSKPRSAPPSSTAIVPAVQKGLTIPEAIEKVLILGDLSSLTPTDRIDYYNRVCRSLALNPLTMPFSYILFRESDGGPAKLSLYANKSCTEQLRKIHGVSIIPPLRRSKTEDIVTVEADVRDKTGRTDSASGSVPLFKYKDNNRIELSGKELCNAEMKCETKAKRRATLSICGLAFLDESELDTMEIVGGVTREGRIYYNQGEEPQKALADPSTVESLKAKGLWCEEHQCARSTNHLKECESSRKAQTPKEGVPGASWKREADAKADMPPIDVKSSQASPASCPAQSEKTAKTVGAPTKLPESAYNKENIPPATKAEPWKYNGTIEFDFSEDQTMPYVRGDIAELAGHFPKDLTLRRKNDWFVCFAEDVDRIKAVCVERNFQVKEIPGGKAPQAGKATTTGRGGGKVASEAAAPVVVKGIIESHTEKMTAKKQPMMSVLLKTEKGKVWYSLHRGIPDTRRP